MQYCFCSLNGDDDSGASDNEKLCSTRSVPSSNGLLCNFEESILNGRLEPSASLEGFRLQLGMLVPTLYVI